MTREVVVLFDDFHSLIHVVLVTFNRQSGVVQVRADVQHLFQQTHVVVERAEKRFNLSGNVNGTSHPIGRFSSYGNRVADGIPPGLPDWGSSQLRKKLLPPYPSLPMRSSFTLLTGVADQYGTRSGAAWVSK